MTPARQRGFLQGACLALALVVASSPLLATLHLALTAHYACPDDGELVESAPAAPHGHGHARGVFSERGPAAQDEAHHHCALALHARAAGRAQDQEAGIAVAPAEPVPSGMPMRVWRQAVAIYRLAPKASPPRA